MFNRSEILRTAWAGYRAQVGHIAGFKFSRKLFSHYLRSAWNSARWHQLYAERCAAEANVPAPVQAARAELLAMEMSDAPVNWDRHRELSVTLFRASVQHEAA